METLSCEPAEIAASENATVVPLMAGFALVAAVVAALFPVQTGVAAVFLFAGPHNWMEARYFLSRIPARWIYRRAFFPVAVAGVLVLGSWFVLGSADCWWHSILAGWIVALVQLSGRKTGGIIALACLWMALASIAAGVAGLLLVFLHPMMALWFLHRQVSRKTPELLPSYRKLLACLPLLAVPVMYWVSGTGSLASTAGVNLLTLPSAAPLIALHIFLELLHYGVWLAAIPVLGLASAPWKLESIPLVRHYAGWPRTVVVVLVGGALAVVILWIGFVADYALTRRIYFTVAIFHVLAEAPMLAWGRSS